MIGISIPVQICALMAKSRRNVIVFPSVAAWLCFGYRWPMARSRHIVEEWERQAEKREASKSLAPLKALKPFLLPYRTMILAAGIALVAAAAASLVMPVAVRG